MCLIIDKIVMSLLENPLSKTLFELIGIESLGLWQIYFEPLWNLFLE